MFALLGLYFGRTAGISPFQAQRPTVQQFALFNNIIGTQSACIVAVISFSCTSTL